MVRRDRNCPENPFRWDRVRMNIPGGNAYPPILTWIYKEKGEDKDLAYEFTTYVDGYRVVDNSE